MKIDQFIDEFNRLEPKDKAAYIANLQKKAGNGDRTALFLTGYLQFPPDWEVMKKASSNGDSELYYNYICALKLDLGISPAQDRNFHQLCYRGRKMNYAPILNRLAITYLCGIGCKQNVKLAKKYFSQAAELGSAEAADNLDYIEFKDLDFWTEQKHRCIHFSELKDVVLLDLYSIRTFGITHPGKTTLRIVTDNKE
jgi:hypothetical protein